MIRAELIKKIHVQKRDLALGDDNYRLILESISGKRSCRDMDDEHLNLVSLALSKMAAVRGRASGASKNPKQQAFIARLMDYLRWDWAATAHFCERVTGKKSTRACTASELSKIILGMIRIIDSDIEKGKLMLNHSQRFEYERHVKHLRGKSAA